MKERIGSIYVLHNLVNDKEYVGQTVRKPEVRWDEHIRAAFVERSCKPLCRAIRKYGLDKFTAEVIWIGPESKLNAAETRFVRRRKTFIDTGWGYNLTTGGGHMKMSRATCEKIRRAAQVYYRSPIGRSKLSAMKLSDWAKADSSERLLLNPVQLRFRASRIREAYKEFSVRSQCSLAQKISYETNPSRKLKLSESLKTAHIADPTISQRVSKALAGIIRSAAMKDKVRIAAKAQWASAEGRAKKIAGMTGKKRTAESRSRMSAAAKGRKWSEHQRAAYADTTGAPSYRAKMSKILHAANVGKPWSAKRRASEDTKRKEREAVLNVKT